MLMNLRMLAYNRAEKWKKEPFLIITVESRVAKQTAMMPNTLLSVARYRESEKSQKIHEQFLKGIWKVAFFRGSPGYDFTLVEGHLLQLCSNGHLAVVSGGKRYEGSWGLNKRDRILDIRLPGNWFTFILSNRWKIVRNGRKLIKLMKECNDGVQELHLEQV